MKKIYTTPTASCELFHANEYVAVCGKTETGKYLFTCDAAAGSLYYYPDGRDSGNAELLGTSYHPCSEKHETDNPDYFYDGFVDYNKNRKEDPDESRLVWVEFGYFGNVKNAHASASLKREMIDVVRS